MSVVPLGGSWKNPNAFLQSIAEDKDIAQFVIVTFTKEGGPKMGQYEMTRADMAFVGALITAEALSGED